MIREVEPVAIDVQKAPERFGLVVRGRRWLLSDPDTIVLALREGAAHAGLTHKQIAERTGTNPLTLNKYYLDPRSRQWRSVSALKLLRLAAACGARIVWEIPDGSDTSY